MGSFSRKFGGNGGNSDTTSSVSPESWSAWNDYQGEAVKGKWVTTGEGRSRKQKVVPAVVNYIMDLGYPSPEKNFYQTKCALPSEVDTYSSEEVEYMKQYKGSDFEWVKEFEGGKQITKRKQSSIGYSRQEFGMCIDIPSILLDYSKHPYAEEGAKKDLRPMRVSLNGLFNRQIQNRIKFEVRNGEMSDRVMLRRISQAAGIDDAFTSGYDIGEFAQAVCNFKLTLNRVEKDGKVSIYPSANTPSPLEDIYFEDELMSSAEDTKQKTLSSEYLSPFTGILLDMEEEDLPDEVLSMVGTGDQHGFVSHASTSIKRHVVWDNGNKEADIGFDYEGCNFQKAYDAWKEKEISKRNPPSGCNTKGEGSKPSSGESNVSGKGVAKDKVESKPEKVVVTPEEDGGWEGDIPF